MSDICKVDPEACPRVDFAKETSRDITEQAYAVNQVVSPSEKGADRIVMPSGHVELGGEMVLIMAQSLPRDATVTAKPASEVKLTDLAMLRLRARRSFARWLELWGATELLAKKPSTTEAPPWQGASLGARGAFTKHFAATLSGAFGPLLSHAGSWWLAEPGLAAKLRIARELRFALNLGGAFTMLDFRGATTAPSWIEEIASGAEAELGSHDGGLWVRLDYYVPVASSPRPSRPDRAAHTLDPQVRLNLQVGGVLSLSEGWDVFASYTFVDRGELDKPSTLLPILDGGFDQQQLSLGVEYRFDPKPENPDRAR